jgi:D-alanyl-D-alanine dipeptidase
MHMRRNFGFWIPACAGMSGGIFLLLAGAAVAQGRLPPGFVYLRDVAPSIAQDMRYASDDNFTGRPLPGYDAPECVLRRDVAQALARVQTDLAKQSLGLKVYDCYRPTRAVRAFARWSQTPDPAPPTKRFFPTLEKRTLFAYGYIAAVSAHSTGNAVDLTLIPIGNASSSVHSRASGNPEPQTQTLRNIPGSPLARGRTVEGPHVAYGPCTGAADKRAPDNSLDMGTAFDCFDNKSHTLSAAIGAEQKRRRSLLLAAMRARGFHNYFREWWHFSFGTRGPAYDVPIERR